MDENYIKKITDRNGYLKGTFEKIDLYSDLDDEYKNKDIYLLKDINVSKCFESNFHWSGEESIVYYNTEIDENNHYFSKSHIKTILEEYNNENWVSKIMEWIDIHPEYALIVNSDHDGQQFYGEDGLNNHGYDIECNDSFLFFYTKELKEKYDELKSNNDIL